MQVQPNNSFKPKLLRSGNGVAEKACHAVPCATQFGLTQVLALMKAIAGLVLVLSLCGCSPWASGADPNGVRLKKQMNLVVDASIKFKADHGSLPQTPIELTPKYLARLPSDGAISISPQSNSVTFVYAPSWPASGRTSCTRTLQDSSWHCLSYV